MEILIDIKLAEYITTIIELRNIQKAAQKLGVRYQTLFQAIKRVEQVMGIKDLFFSSHKGTIELNPDHSSIYDLCHQMVLLGQKAHDLATHKMSTESVSLYSTQTMNEAFFVPFYNLWEKEQPQTILKLKEDDSFSVPNPKFNEISTVNKVLDDRSKYEYFPFHNFRQKLWASKKYIEKMGPFETIQDLKGKTIFFQKVSCNWGGASGQDKELIGYRGLVSNLLANKSLEMNILDIEGIRTIDLLCETGIGIMPAAAEPLELMGRKLVNILPSLSGEDITIYFKVRKDSLKESPSIRKLIDFIFMCRDRQFSHLGVSPLYPIPDLNKK